MDRKLSFAELIGATMTLMSGDLPVVLGIVAALTAVATFIDVAAPLASLALAIATLVTQYYLIRRLVDRLGLRSADRPAGFASFFVLGFITNLGIGLGFILLVLPGIYLSARWSMAGAALLAENEGSGAAMRRSSDATRDHILPIALTWVLITLPFFAGAVMGGAFDVMARNSDGTNQATVIALDAGFNLLVYASQVTSWYFAVAIYQLLAEPVETRLGEVFA